MDRFERPAQLKSQPTTLTELIVAQADIGADTLARARLIQTETNERLESVLTRLGIISEQALANLIVNATGLDVVDPAAFPTEPLERDRISIRFLRDYKIVLLGESDGVFEVAMVDPFDAFPLEALELALARPVKAKIARASDVEANLERLYGGAEANLIAIDDEADLADLERLKDLASDAPAIRSLNRLISSAVEERASDIHLEATQDSLLVRFRVDGEMRFKDTLPANMKAPVVARIKVMAGLNIAEKRAPQDGRLRLAVKGHDIDLRVATSPTINGESAVLRLLDRSNLTLDYESLGFDAELIGALRQVLTVPNGVVLVTGPTGSGKTTTLYAALAELNTTNRKILTIEDPIEYRMAGVNQTQVNPQIGLTFAAALRSFLRQDPDIMMVGEIRDVETARVAVQAALTGHMILSTLHTNNAASAVTRLIDMGVEPFLITSTLNAVLAQRLVRRLCPSCRKPAKTVGPTQLYAISPQSASFIEGQFFDPVGCLACDGSGFIGRIAICELLTMTGDIAKLVLERADARDIAAASAGLNGTMLDDGLRKARAGETTLQEVLRATGET